jgi:hypothetical protein
MSDLTWEIARNNFIGIGISWNRRSMFEYGWITLELPLFHITVEWQPDREAFDERYGLRENKE